MPSEMLNPTVPSLDLSTQAHLSAGRLLQAEYALRAALEATPMALEPLMNLGAVLHMRGHIVSALSLYERALAIAPRDIDLISNRAHALLDAGRGFEALQSLRNLPAILSEHPLLQATQGALLYALDDFTAARATLRAITATGRVDEMAWVNLSLCERALCEPEKALVALTEARDINPNNARATAELVDLLTLLERCTEACEIADNFLANHPGDRQVLAACAIALEICGRQEEAKEIVDLDRMITLHDLGHDGLPVALAEEIAELLRADPSCLASPLSKATRGGFQTGELDPSYHPALLALEALILGQLNNECPLQPLQQWHLRLWGTLIESGGQQITHMHPRSEMSGVFYILLPDEMQSKDIFAGALEFGRPPARSTMPLMTVTRCVTPAPGRLVLFPSHLWHRTLPFEATGTRISVAFDATVQNRESYEESLQISPA